MTKMIELFCPPAWLKVADEPRTDGSFLRCARCAQPLRLHKVQTGPLSEERAERTWVTRELAVAQ